MSCKLQSEKSLNVTLAFKIVEDEFKKYIIVSIRLTEELDY